MKILNYIFRPWSKIKELEQTNKQLVSTLFEQSRTIEQLKTVDNWNTKINEWAAAMQVQQEAYFESRKTTILDQKVIDNKLDKYLADMKTVDISEEIDMFDKQCI